MFRHYLKKKNKTYLDTSDDAPPLPYKQKKYFDVVNNNNKNNNEYDTIEYL